MSLEHEVDVLEEMLSFLDDEKKNKAEIKIIEKLVEVARLMSDRMDDLEEENTTLTDYLDQISEDLAFLEDATYDLDDEEITVDETLIIEEASEEFEVDCPECGKVLLINLAQLEENMASCGDCGAVLEFDVQIDLGT